MEKLEAAFEYVIDHPEAIMLIGGMFFALISIFLVFESGTAQFLRLITIGLLICGVVLYAVRLGLPFIIKVFRKLLA